MVLPFDFTKIVWGALIGYLAFGEVVDIWTWLGAGVIFLRGHLYYLPGAQADKGVRIGPNHRLQ